MSDNLREQLREIWRPLLDKSTHAQEMAYLITLATDETEALLAQSRTELLERIRRELPEVKTKGDVPHPDEGVSSTIPIAKAFGYNCAISDMREAINKILEAENE